MGIDGAEIKKRRLQQKQSNEHLVKPDTLDFSSITNKQEENQEKIAKPIPSISDISEITKEVKMFDGKILNSPPKPQPIPIIKDSPPIKEEEKKKERTGCVLVLLGFLALIIIVSFTDERKNQPLSSEEIEQRNRENMIALSQVTVQSMLKDQKSAEFRNIFFHRGANKASAVCGEVNSKNSFGGYNGYQKYVYAGPALTFLQEQGPEFYKIWNMFCTE